MKQRDWKGNEDEKQMKRKGRRKRERKVSTDETIGDRENGRRTKMTGDGENGSRTRKEKQTKGKERRKSVRKVNTDENNMKRDGKKRRIWRRARTRSRWR